MQHLLKPVHRNHWMRVIQDHDPGDEHPRAADERLGHHMVNASPEPDAPAHPNA